MIHQPLPPSLPPPLTAIVKGRIVPAPAALHYLEGDVTEPVKTGMERVVAHVCNDIGAWGRGVSGAIGARWPLAEKAYRSKRSEGYRRGTNIDVAVSTHDGGLSVCNMVAQRGIVGPGNPHPLDYDALEACMKDLADYLDHRLQIVTIHAPKFGSGLARGNWPRIEEMINQHWIDRGYPVFVYTPQPV